MMISIFERDTHTYIHTHTHTYIFVGPESDCDPYTNAPADAGGKKCLVGKEGQCKRVRLPEYLSGIKA